MAANRGETYRDLEGAEWEVVAFDGAVTDAVTLRPKGGGEQVTVPIVDFKSQYSYVHPGNVSGPVADAAQRGYEGGELGDE